MSREKTESQLRFDKDPDVSSYDIESDDSTVMSICYILFEVLSVFEDLRSVMSWMFGARSHYYRERNIYLDRNLVDVVTVNVNRFQSSVTSNSFQRN